MGRRQRIGVFRRIKILNKRTKITLDTSRKKTTPGEKTLDKDDLKHKEWHEREAVVGCKVVWSSRSDKVVGGA